MNIIDKILNTLDSVLSDILDGIDETSEVLNEVGGSLLTKAFYQKHRAGQALRALIRKSHYMSWASALLDQVNIQLNNSFAVGTTNIEKETALQRVNETLMLIMTFIDDIDVDDLLIILEKLDRTKRLLRHNKNFSLEEQAQLLFIKLHEKKLPKHPYLFG